MYWYQLVDSYYKGKMLMNIVRLLNNSMEKQLKEKKLKESKIYKADISQPLPPEWDWWNTAADDVWDKLYGDEFKDEKV